MKKTFALIGVLAAAVIALVFASTSAQAADCTSVPGFAQSVCVPTSAEAAPILTQLQNAISAGNVGQILTSLYALFLLIFPA